MLPSNADVARVLGELAVLSEIDEGSPQAFRVRAYQNAQRSIEQQTGEVARMSASQLAGLKGIGRSTADKIREYVDTGSIRKLEELRARHPVGKQELLRVPGLGPKTIGLLDELLGVRDLPSLRAALDDGRIAALPGLGEKTADNLRRAIEQLGLSSKQTRVPLHVAKPLAERLVAALERLDAVEQAAYAGSVRRFRETIGDLDVLVASRDPATVTEAFLGLGEIASVIGSGATKTSVLTSEGVQVDLRVVPPESFGAALLYFTGSRAHNIRLRQRALRRGLTLNEYALARLPEDEQEPAAPHVGEDREADGEADPGADGERDATGDTRRDLEVMAQGTEEEVYAALGLPYIAAELREDDGEIEAAEAGTAPQLVERADLRGDLHDHTDWSGDGRASLEDMVAGAVARGHAYLGLTDHAEDLRINGISRDGMLRQRRLVRELEQERGDIRLLHGAELNIGVDGSLDYDAEFLAGFDWLVASVHSHFTRPVGEQTARVLAAIRHPSVTAIGHLHGRMIGKRPGIELDLDRVLDAAVETGTAIEVNSNLRRLDASAEVIREGARRGVTFVISTDAHAVGELDNLRHGVANARRGGLPRDQVANTWPLERFESWVAAVRGA
ncbi:helix-hairpin-helix domain-containing protein [Egicoccus halophilus]|uniref:DNA polymerase beta n=1 Tax=Egicoccus halophilus TaxID=1670830 RepID=A0A8J3EUE1_9ACTN|nr:helix-hairpin-helix domain-containing protein [Egicoccus halophilus]GGI07514.1 PHP-like protein [Egicoccus halophilus]